MKSKLFLFLFILSSSTFAQNRMYNLTTQFDSVKVKKLLMTSILEGGVNDSVLVKKANGGMFKVARSSFGSGSGTVTSVAATGGYGIVTPVVTNPTTTPSIPIAVDTTSANGVVSKGRLATNLSGYVTVNGSQGITGAKTFTQILTVQNSGGIRINNSVGQIVTELTNSLETTYSLGTLTLRAYNSSGGTNYQQSIVANKDITSTTAPTQMPLTGGGVLAKTDQLAIPYSFSTTGTAQTVFTVTIGQTMANTTYKVAVTPTSMLAAASYYVPDANKTTTTFDVVYLTGITGLVSFEGAVFK